MIEVKYDGKPFEFSAKRKLVALSVNTTEMIPVYHGCLNIPVLAYIVQTDSEVLMTSQCMEKDVAYLTFSQAPCNVIICFE